MIINVTHLTDPYLDCKNEREIASEQVILLYAEFIPKEYKAISCSPGGMLSMDLEAYTLLWCHPAKLRSAVKRNAFNRQAFL